MNIGLLGGTFDPVHTGHLVLAQECFYRFSLDKVVFVPAYRSPLKPPESGTPAQSRLEMVRLAVSGDGRFEVSDHEVSKGCVSYTVETVEHFMRVYGKGARFFFITGSDSLEDLSSWKDVDRLLDLVTFVAASRPGWSLNSPYMKRLKPVVIPRVEVSSSMIRDRVRRNEPIDYLVPKAVADHIRLHGLYK
jgi:nicotinate-nucleotide adenylyltransferase